MIAIRRRTRETLRHERAVVRQELGTPTAAQIAQDWETNKQRAAVLRRAAQRGGEPDARLLGLVMRDTVAGGNGSTGQPCSKCGEIDGHTGQCPVVS